MFRYQIDKPTHGSEEWLRVRWSDAQGNKRVSASVAGAIYNEHPYTSAAQLAAELLSPVPPTPQPTTMDMERGNRMEPMLIEWAASMENKELHTPDKMYCYEDGACRMIATLDAIDVDGIPYEVKTTRKRWDGELPRHWYWQGVHQAMCAGADRVEWVIFDSSMQMHRHTQYVSSDETTQHGIAVAWFLGAIDNGEMPESASWEYKMVENMFPESEPLTVELDETGHQTVLALMQVQDQIKELEKQESELKADIGLRLQDAEVALYNGEQVVTWKTAKRDTLDTKALEAAHPALVNKFRKVTQYRVMKTKRRK